ncbi:MAG: hypothetical protein IPG60_14750 [Bacteroidetes bacterium]|nr:hypothetical protein [Bacteroidota bacterium]MBP7399858.1 hypothetical protein [Chitinophagales bacterium]MBK8487151.1 hypothetical protein [Bacteroidota bacterium]MBK8680537.1 hypothetical protein [Bacteroidota bacterium]MBP8752698.1 hypothetical protein [Chitinophagales bacterium]
MKNRYLIILTILSFNISALVAQNFTDDFQILLEAEDISDLKNEFTSYSEGLDANLYTSRQELEGFYITIVDQAGYWIIYGTSNGDLPKVLNALNMMELIPPTGYTMFDSNDDESIALGEGTKRRVTFVSDDRSSIANFNYSFDNSLTFTITKK